MTMKQARKQHREWYENTGMASYVPFREWIRGEAPDADSPKLREILKQ